MIAELENGDVVELLGLMNTTLPDGSNQYLYYYLYNGVKTPLCYAHSPYKRLQSEEITNMNTYYPRYNPNTIEVWNTNTYLPRPPMRDPTT